MNNNTKIVTTIAFAIVCFGIYIAINWKNFEDKTSISGLLVDAGYAEFQPPSKLAFPGTWVQILNNNPLNLSTVCLPEQALGLKIGDIPTSPIPDTKLTAKLTQTLNVDADYLSALKANTNISQIRDVSITLKNVMILELSDASIIGAIASRTDNCRQAIKSAIEAGETITMIKSALIGDVEYTVKIDQSGGGSIDASEKAKLGASLNSKLTTEENNELIFSGYQLIWGVRDHSRLARAGFEGLAPTGSGEPASNPNNSDHDNITKDNQSRIELLPGNGPIKKIEIDKQVRRTFAPETKMVAHNVKPKKQIGTNDCWAVVYSMMMSWKTGENLSVVNSVNDLGPTYSNYYASNNGLPGGQELKFVTDANMQAQPPASFFLASYVEMLRDHGPLWIITGNGINSHAKLLVGVYADSIEETTEAYESAVFEFIDPFSGTYKYQPALNFMTEFEQEARFIVDTQQEKEDLRWQILHF